MTLNTTPERQLIARLSDSLSHVGSLQALVRPLLEMLEAVTGLESTYMTAIDEPAGMQHILYARNSRSLQIPEGLGVAWEDTLCRRALEEGRIYVDDVPGTWGDSKAARALGIATYASSPIQGRDDRLYGMLCAASDQRKPMAADADRVLRMFSRLIGQQVEREQLVQELQRANEALARNALTDQATGLPNRRALMDELARRLARRGREHGALLVAFIDLDGFKAINDRHSHEAGDRLLVLVGAALSQAARAGDYCARLGGDEFVVLASVTTEEWARESPSTMTAPASARSWRRPTSTTSTPCWHSRMRRCMRRNGCARPKSCARRAAAPSTPPAARLPSRR